MGMCLVVAALSSWISWEMLLVILQVAFGLGMVIFVHELGHFLVAKACGVKCEKFYVGFDVPIRIGLWTLPRTLGKFQWGETEYGIGIIPLGGYVKMLGQDDNPANYQAEIERTKVRKTENDLSEAKDETEGEEKVSDQESNEEVELDPRSYPAKAVWQRMAIISAGVIMNIIFAAIFAVMGFRLGVKYIPCLIGGATPGYPAWAADLRPGDHIIQIGKEGEPNEQLRFDRDLRGKVMFSDTQDEIEFLVRRGEKTFWIKLNPTTEFSSESTPRVGVYFAHTNVIADVLRADETQTESAGTDQEFQPGDRVVAINGQPISDKPIEGGLQIQSVFASRPNDVLTFTVERIGKDDGQGDPQRLDIEVAKRPARRLGLVMHMGSITAVRKDSPAEFAGIKVGDRIRSLDGKGVLDPITLPDQLRALAGKTVSIEILRDGESLTIEVTPVVPSTLMHSEVPGSSIPAEALGVVFTVSGQVASVIPESPAEKSGMQTDDEIIKVEFVPAEGKRGHELKRTGDLDPVEISVQNKNWPHVYFRMQHVLPDTQIKLTYRRPGEASQSQILMPEESEEWFLADRRFRFEPASEDLHVDSWGQAFWFGLQQTGDDLTMVLVFLKKLATGGISPTNLGGPVTIAAAAGSEATQGLGRFLLFLTLLSANLAVVNFLPIPVLDGGHMLFLTAEGIRGKPVGERLQFQLTIAGLVFILGLMVFVIGLDIHRLSSWF